MKVTIKRQGDGLLAVFPSGEEMYFPLSTAAALGHALNEWFGQALVDARKARTP